MVVPNPGMSKIWSSSPGLLIDRTYSQWDGSMFLGFPVLLLLAIAFVRSPRQVGCAIRRHAPLALALVAMLAFAASNRAFVFDRTLWSFDVPGPLATITGTFRASGRFAWPFGLAVVLGTLAFTLRTLRPALAVPLVLLLAGVSVVEGLTAMQVVRANTNHGAPRALDPAIFRPALAAHERIEQWPSYQCLGAAMAMADQDSRDLQLMAAELGRPINGVRAGRQTTSCKLETQQWRPFETPPGVIAFHLRALVDVDRPASCRPLRNWVICTDAWMRPELAALRALTEREQPAPAYRIGERLDFGPEKHAGRYLDGHWSRSVTYPQLNIGEHLAGLRMHVDPPGEYMLTLELEGWFGGGDVRVFVNGTELGQFRVNDPRKVELALPQVGGPTEIAFRATPLEARGSLGVRALTLSPHRSPPNAP
jgi:hypothetical protein